MGNLTPTEQHKESDGYDSGWDTGVGGDICCGAESVTPNAAPTGRFFGNVPLPPDLAAISVHQKTCMQPGDTRRARHAFGNEADYESKWPPGGAPAEIG